MKLIYQYLKAASLTFIFISCIICTHAQKPVVDSNAYKKWQGVGDIVVSNDGNYALFPIRNVPAGSRTLVIRSVQGDSKIGIEGVYGGSFSDDSRCAILSKPHDSLAIVHLEDFTVKDIANVSSFKIPSEGGGQWLAYLIKNDKKQLVLYNLVSAESRIIDSVVNYTFNKAGTAIVVLSGSKEGNAGEQTLKWITLPDYRESMIWQGQVASSLTFDAEGRQLAFIAGSKTGRLLWNYDSETGKAVKSFGDTLTGIDSSLMLGDIKGFNNQGTGIFFSLKRRDMPKLKSNLVKVDIWSYSDKELQSQQLYDLDRGGPEGDNICFVNIRQGKVMRLEGENDRIISPLPTSEGNLLAVVSNLRIGRSEWTWNRKNQVSVSLVSTLTGDRKLICGNIPPYDEGSYMLSKTGKYLVYYDPAAKNYFCYTVSSGQVHNMTKGISATWTTYYDDDYPGPSPKILGSFTEGDSVCYLYDRTDIWRVDLDKGGEPLNFTHGYGRRNNVILRMITLPDGSILKKDSALILSGFNQVNKNDGYFALRSGGKEDPELLTMQPFVFTGPPDNIDVQYRAPIKAKSGDVFIVRRMSSSESPNYFWTTDFKTFKPLSNTYPERDYNWFSTKLVTWRALDGQMAQGVLYMPEDFDPKKKYPVIFYYYEKLSDGLNDYIPPGASEGQINIPFFASNGYLVFVPDIHYKVGETGKGAYNYVVSAANYLAKKPWVDSTKMAIQGHSRGGYQTNYIVTHTNIFAAAMSASGISDFISDYNNIRIHGNSGQLSYESGPQRIGTSLWQNPYLYIENSPIFNADKVNTPVLLMNNKLDGQIAFVQGVEFFTALRRLGKQAWMLQYDGEDHTVSGRAADDLTIRIKQFFDYYLKGAAAPKWMVEGIAASNKGIDDGLELEAPGVQPGPNLLTPEEQKKVDALQYRRPITVTIP